jgi:transcription initiation factor TFIID TATA-box-binding protein
VPQVKATISIENVVASATISQKVDLNSILKGCSPVEDTTKKAPGIGSRLKSKKSQLSTQQHVEPQNYHVKYAPDTFPGLIFRLKRPKTTTLIFNSGKMVCTGAKSTKEARRAVMNVIKELKKSGIIIISKPEFKIQNIVASGNLGGMTDLEKAADMLKKNTMYEPEQFPGLIYRMESPKVVILLFASGKLVCTGAKNEEDVYAAVDKLHELLEQTNFIEYEY